MAETKLNPKRVVLTRPLITKKGHTERGATVKVPDELSKSDAIRFINIGYAHDPDTAEGKEKLAQARKTDAEREKLLEEERAKLEKAGE